MVNLRATMLDDHSWFVPFVETATAEALPWAKTDAVHSFPNFPETAAFQAVVPEFAERGCRPR
jgi:hypothetical protein